MAGNEEIATVIREGTGRATIRLADIDPNQYIDQLHDLLAGLIRKGTCRLVLSMDKAPFPNASFIAMLVGLTREARRRGGDIRLIDMAETATGHLNQFTPLTYLTIGDDAEHLIISKELDTIDFQPGILQSITLGATIEEVNRATAFVVECARQAGLDKIESHKLNIAVYEACLNIVEHGYGFDPEKTMRVEVLWIEDFLEINLWDWGKSFDFYEKKYYDVQQAFEEKREGGFGLFIIKRSVDSYSYSSDKEKGNCLNLRKRIKEGD